MYTNLTSRAHNKMYTGVVDTSWASAHISFPDDNEKWKWERARVNENGIENESRTGNTPNIRRVKYVLPLIFNKEKRH